MNKYEALVIESKLIARGNKIKSLREKKFLSKTRLAKMSNVGYTTLYYLEKGNIEFPRNEALLRIAKALDVPVEYLALDNNEPLESFIKKQRTIEEVRAEIVRHKNSLTNNYLTRGFTTYEDGVYECCNFLLRFIDGKEDSVAIACEPEAQHGKDES